MKLLFQSGKMIIEINCKITKIVWKTYQYMQYGHSTNYYVCLCEFVYDNFTFKICSEYLTVCFKEIPKYKRIKRFWYYDNNIVDFIKYGHMQITVSPCSISTHNIEESIFIT